MSSISCTNFVRNTLVSAIAMTSIVGATTASAQNYRYQVQPYPYSQPYTGAGSTMQPSWNNYQMPQQRPPAERPAQMPTYRPNVTGPGGNQFQYVPELGNWVPTYIAPQTADRIYDATAGCVSRGAEGAAWGAAGGGRRGAIVGGVQGCLNR